MMDEGQRGRMVTMCSEVVVEVEVEVEVVQVVVVVVVVLVLVLVLRHADLGVGLLCLLIRSGPGGYKDHNRLAPRPALVLAAEGNGQQVI